MKTVIKIFDNQKSVGISFEKIQKICQVILVEESINCDELSVYFVDRKKIKELHRDFFNDDTETDCISFPIDDPNEKNKNGYCILGEIVVCTDVAKDYAISNNLDFMKETYLYLIHGLLHLIGYDDIKEKDRLIMRQKENYYLNLLKQKKIIE